MGNVVVLGSLNFDTVAVVDEFPKPGNTILAKSLAFLTGGKGGNQAIAAAKQGANVMMIGSVGDDSAGDAYLELLKHRGIRTDGVFVRKGTPTGTALICVNKEGENTIVVGLGANGLLTDLEVQDQQQWIAMGTVMLAQFEVPMEAVAAALRIAKPLGTTTCLNPSPWREGFPWGEVELDFVIVNEHEAAQLLGKPVMSMGDIGWIRAKTKEMGINTLIVTRGAESTLAFSNKGPSLEVPTMPATPVDTVGAGDCFAGVFAARWAELRALELSLRAASVAGTLATLKAGAQEAMPDRNAVDEALGDAIRELMRG
jgi:ribokinase